MDRRRALQVGLFVERVCYPLVMTNSLPWKITMLLIGKPSISMGHLYHGYVKQPEGNRSMLCVRGETCVAFLQILS